MALDLRAVGFAWLLQSLCELLKGVVKKWDPSLGTATIAGVVSFSGKAPRRRPIDMGAKPECGKLHQNKVLDESIVVNPNGTLKHVFVWVKKGLERWRFAAPKEPVLLDQKGCVYVPHVFGVQVKQPLSVRNSDPTMHNIHSFSTRNAPFNFGQTPAQEALTRKFKRPEVMVKVKCDVHGWMSSYVGVVRHPFFSVTGDEGKFDLRNLPPGEYTVEAWHEEYGRETLDVTVADKESKEIKFAFGDSKS